MISPDNYDGAWESGYAVGWDEGRKEGYDTGYQDAVNEYDNRLAKYWAELQTLNARVTHLETASTENYNG